MAKNPLKTENLLRYLQVVATGGNTENFTVKKSAFRMGIRNPFIIVFFTDWLYVTNVLFIFHIFYISPLCCLYLTKNDNGSRPDISHVCHWGAPSPVRGLPKTINIGRKIDTDPKDGRYKTLGTGFLHTMECMVAQIIVHLSRRWMFPGTRNWTIQWTPSPQFNAGKVQ